MLWDGSKGVWTYILLNGSFGSDPLLLPDGCVLSAFPLAIYNPRDDSVKHLSDPGFGAHERERAVMDDGTVVVAGPGDGERDNGAGFFYSKASCAGFTPAPGREGYIAADLAVVPAAPVAAAVAPPVPQPGWRQRVQAGFHQFKWILLAIAGPLIGYALLRRVRLRRLRGTPSWLLRAVVYGALLFVGLPVIWSLTVLKEQRAQPGAGPVPCRMVGLWSLLHGGVMRRVELKDDGSFVQAESRVGGDKPGGYKGQWEVKGDAIIWYADNPAAEPDVNPMEQTGPSSFVLTEGNGSKTKFDMIRPAESTRCTRD